MSYITSNQGRPIQGVSQQPDKNRYPGQCTASNNFRPDVVHGLTTRQGTKATGTLSGASKNRLSKWHHYVRNNEEYFIEVQPNGTLKAWSPDGTVHTVNVQDSANTYLANSNPLNNLEMKTVGDYTFLINRDKVVEKSSSRSSALVNQAIVYVQFADYTQKTSVYINGSRVGWQQCEKGDDASDKRSTRPDVVAGKIYSGMNGESGGPTADDGTWGGTDISETYNMTLSHNCIFISRKDGDSFTITVTDGVNNANAVAIFKEIEKTTLLPNRAPANFRVKVSPPGGNTSENASYWLQATTATGSSGNTLTWNETVAPNLVLGMNPATMPHVLVRESVASGVATFTLRQGEWEDRKVGDDRTNPLPSFIGEKIKSMGIMQNRLYFTAGEAVIMSRSGKFFNFFRTTAQASLDTDPIDVFADSEQVNYLNASVEFDGDLVFFSKDAQFLLPGDKQLTAANAVLRKTTDFETLTSVVPVASGDNIFFAFNYGRFTGVREYFTDSVTDTKRARPVTDHVKEYIKGKPKIMVSSTNLNMLLIKADANDVLYCYDWLWQGSEKVQSAWGKLTFSGAIIYHLAFVDDVLKIILQRDSKIVCEVIDLGDADTDGLSFPVRLDAQTKVTFTWDETDEVWKTPAGSENDDLVIVRGTGCYESEIGTRVNFELVDDEFWSYDDLSSKATCTCIIGLPYNCSYTPTNPVAKDQNEQAMNLDKLTVGAFYINYNTTGDITVTVTDDYGRKRTSSYGNRVFGAAENIVGFATLTEGQHRIPIRAKSDKYTLTIETNDHVPLTIRDFSFNGNLNKRGIRI